MDKEFVPYPEAFELKQIGFDEPCFGFHTEEYKTLIKNFCKYPINLPTKPFLAPTFSQAFRFFREFRDYEDWCIESWIQPYLSDEPRQYEAFYWRRGEKVSVGVYSTYYEAQLCLLRKLIEIVKTKQ